MALSYSEIKIQLLSWKIVLSPRLSEEGTKERRGKNEKCQICQWQYRELKCRPSNSQSMLWSLTFSLRWSLYLTPHYLSRRLLSEWMSDHPTVFCNISLPLPPKTSTLLHHIHPFVHSIVPTCNAHCSSPGQCLVPGPFGTPLPAFIKPEEKEPWGWAQVFRLSGKSPVEDPNPCSARRWLFGLE